MIMSLSPKEQMQLLLIKAGWYEGRHVDISKFENMCREKSITLFDKAREFLHSYWGINPSVKLQFLDEFEIIRTFELDFAIELVHFEEEDYVEEIGTETKEDFIALGEFGYYYPGVIAIGVSGKLYVWHDYGSGARSYDSLEEAMAGELTKHEVDTDSLYS